MTLGTIEEEARACREAFDGVRLGEWAQHCHHTDGCERLWFEPEIRIQYIIDTKPKNEIALRLRLFRPVELPQEDIAIVDAIYRLRAEAVISWRPVAFLKTRVKHGADVMMDTAPELSAACDRIRDYYNANHSTLCKEPECTWNGKEILFPSTVDKEKS